MSSLAELPEVVGFFSYSREDDADSQGALSALRTRIQAELRGQLGRTAKTFRLWQDKEAIPAGTLWEAEIKTAVGQAVFFIPIVTPTVVASPYCGFELDAFLAREAALGRSDLVFPILYIDVPALEDSVRRQNDPVLSLIAKRQYVDWREFRYLDVNSTELKREVGRFCTHIRDALQRPWLSPEEHKQQEEAAARQQAEAERQRRELEAKRLAEEEACQRAADQRKPEIEQRLKVEAKAKSAAEEEWRRREADQDKEGHTERKRPAAPAGTSIPQSLGQNEQTSPAGTLAASIATRAPWVYVALVLTVSAIFIVLIMNTHAPPDIIIMGLTAGTLVVVLAVVSVACIISLLAILFVRKLRVRSK
jgi:hypothetical protein